jgi:TonB family protein
MVMLRRFIFLMLLVLSFGLSSVLAQRETLPIAGKPHNGGVINGKAISLPKPEFPAAAKAVNASGAVNVQVLIDEAGNVVSAEAVSGHPLLRQAAEQAATAAKFKPTFLSGQAVKVNGVIVYNFVGPSPSWTNVGFQFGTAESQGIRSEINLPEEFAEEKSQLTSLIKLSPQEQMGQIVNTISMIKARLNPTDLWHFEFGLARGRILSNTESEGSIFENLARIKNLADNLPEGVQSYDTVRAGKLAKFADKDKLTAEDKEAILKLLR